MLHTLAGFVDLIFKLFEVLILGRVLISWVGTDPNNQVVQLLHNATEPFLAPVRRRLPPTGMFDISPLVVIIIALLLDNVIVTVLLSL
jgi:YggT family protein